MNRNDVVSRISDNTGISYEVVEKVLKVAEEVGGLTLLRKARFKDNNKSSVLAEIATASEYSDEVCATILDEFSEVFRQGLVDKLTFKK